MRGNAQRISRPAQTRLLNSGVTRYCMEVHRIFVRRRRVIGGVKPRIRVAILTALVECQCREWRSSPIGAKISYHSNIRWAIAIKEVKRLCLHICVPILKICT